jgi:hypothetical protein
MPMGFAWFVPASETTHYFLHESVSRYESQTFFPERSSLRPLKNPVDALGGLNRRRGWRGWRWVEEGGTCGLRAVAGPGRDTSG